MTYASFDELKPLIDGLSRNKGWLSVTFVCPTRGTKLISSGKIPDHEDSTDKLQAAKHRATVIGANVATLALGPAGRAARLAMNVGGKRSLSKQVDEFLRLEEPATQKAVLDAFAAVRHRFVRKDGAVVATDGPVDDDEEPFFHQMREVPVSDPNDQEVMARALVDVLRRGDAEPGESRLIAEQLLLVVGGPALDAFASSAPPVERDLKGVRWAPRSTLWMATCAVADNLSPGDVVLDRWLEALAKGLKVGWTRRMTLRRWARCYVIRAAVEDARDEGASWSDVKTLALERGGAMDLAKMHCEGVVARAKRARHTAKRNPA